MNILELTAYSRRRIKGRRREVLLVCLLPVGAELLFRLGELALYSFMLYFGIIKPFALFTGENTEQLIAMAVMTAVRWLMTAPLICAAGYKLIGMTEGREQDVSVSELLLEKGFALRSITAFLTGRLVSFAVLIPAAASAWYAWSQASRGADSSGLFIAVNMTVLAAVLLVIWAAVRIDLTAVPFILAARPELSGAGAVFAALRFMSGRTGLPLKLAAVYFLPLLTLAGIPFFLPEAVFAYAAGIGIYIKEDEYAAQGGAGHEQAEIRGRYR